MTDFFASHQSGLESPATRLATITPSDDDSVNLAFATRAIAVSEPGFVRLTSVDGYTGTIFVVPGVPFPMRARKVWASGTTATGIVALA